VRQVGYLLELYRDARSPEYKISCFILERRVCQNGFTWTHQAWTNFFHSLSSLYPTSALRLYNVSLIANPLETVRHM